MDIDRYSYHLLFFHFSSIDRGGSLRITNELGLITFDDGEMEVRLCSKKVITFFYDNNFY